MFKECNTKNDVISYLKNKFGKVFLSGSEEYGAALVKEIKNFANSEITTCLIEPFYYSKRVEMIKKVCHLYDKDSPEQLSAVTNLVNRSLLDKQLISISSNPLYLLLMLDYVISNDLIGDGISNLSFNKVFESNIYFTLAKFCGHEQIDEYGLVLQELAHLIHFNKLKYLSDQQVLDVIISYNAETGERVSFNQFTVSLSEARILIRSSIAEGYVFASNDILAFFAVWKSEKTRFKSAVA